MWWRIGKYLMHQFNLRHRHGHGIHSPYLFEVVHSVIFNAIGIRVPGWVTEVHRQLRSEKAMLPAAGPGAPSLVKGGPQKSVSSFVARSSVTEKYGALLFRISHWFRPEVILELGTGVGISTLYLAAGSPGVPVHTIEGIRERADFSEELFKRSRLATVQVHVGEMEEVLGSLAGEVNGRMLVFVDGNHRFDPTIGYLKWILRQAGAESVVVMDDLYWSKEMIRAWREIISWSEVRMSIDLYQMGVLLLRTDLNKVELKIKF